MTETIGFVFGQMLHTGGTRVIYGDDVAPCLLSRDFAMVAFEELDEEKKDGQNQRYTSALAEKVLGSLPEPKPHD